MVHFETMRLLLVAIPKAWREYGPDTVDARRTAALRACVHEGAGLSVYMDAESSILEWRGRAKEE